MVQHQVTRRTSGDRTKLLSRSVPRGSCSRWGGVANRNGITVASSIPRRGHNGLWAEFPAEIGLYFTVCGKSEPKDRNKTSQRNESFIGED